MPPTLRFRADKTFTIVQFTDTHFKNGEQGDDLTTDLMRAVLAAEKPDLVIFTGDVIEGERCEDPATSWLRAVRPVIDAGIPWAAVFGNHDDEGTLDRFDLMQVQEDLPGCLSHPGPAHVSGVGNYVLPVWSADADRAAAHLYCLDSNSYAEPNWRGEKVEGYGWIRRDQIDWYLETAQRLTASNGGTPLPALAFFHIPLPEYDEVWDLHPCYGVKYEPICPPRLNSGFFAALVEAGDVMGTFVGHDHVNDFWGELHGIRLCYGRATGFNTYGLYPEVQHGARVIRLVEGERDFTTWIRQEDGTTVHTQPRHEPEGVRSLTPRQAE